MKRTIQIEITKELYEKTGGMVRTILFQSGFSRHEIARLKFAGEISSGGKVLRVSQRLPAGSVLKLVFPEKDNSDDTEGTAAVDIRYEDEDTAVLFKPAGIPVHASHGHLDDSLGTALSGYYRRQGEKLTVRTVGRLDTPVSGLVLYAKNQPAAARLSAQRQDGRLGKTYEAIVSGCFAEEKGTIRMPLIKQENSRGRTVSEEGKEACTDWEVVRRLDLCGRPAALVRVVIRTGRTHQIRAHMAAAGHPLLGDSLYGGDTRLISRPALHCGMIRYISPFTMRPVEIRADMPDDMMELLAAAAGP